MATQIRHNQGILAGKSMPLHTFKDREHDFIIRSDKKKRKLKQLSIGHEDQGIISLKPILQTTVKQDDSAKSLREIEDNIRKSKKIVKKKKIILTGDPFIPKTGID